MKVLANILLSTQVTNLIRAKSNKSIHLISLHPDDTIRKALTTFLEFDITAAPIIRKTLDNNFDIIGMLRVPDILNFILNGTVEDFYGQGVETLLNRPIQDIIDAVPLKKIRIINERISLMQLLLHFSGICDPGGNEDDPDYDNKHLLVKCGLSKYEVITPTDFMRYILLVSHESGYLSNTSASEIPNTFLINDASVAHPDEDALDAFSRLLLTKPHYLLAVIDPKSGDLTANLSAVDFLPVDSRLLLESISLLRTPGISLYSYVHYIKPARILNDLDPILIYPHYTITDMIKKMITMQIHQLWRVSPDRPQKPVGPVGILDILAYLKKLLQPFLINQFQAS